MEELPQEKILLYVVLEGAPLKTAHVGKDMVILNNEEHSGFIQKKLNMDPSLFRPDILHQVASPVSPDPPRLAPQQVWSPPGFHPHRRQRANFG